MDCFNVNCPFRHNDNRCDCFCLNRQKSPITYNSTDITEQRDIKLQDVYKIIAGHSNYHGDDILAALTCLAEGKQVAPVKPLQEER